MKKKPPKSYYVKLFFGAIEETFQFEHFIPHWLPVWAWMFFIFYLSSLTEFSTGFAGGLDLLLKKLWHFFAFFALAALVYRAFRSYRFSKGDAYLLCATWSLVYAISDEIHQLFVPGRHGTVVDVIIDLVGILLFGILVKLFVGGKKK